MAAAPKMTANYHPDDHVWVAEGGLDGVAIVAAAASYEDLRERVAEAVALAVGDVGVAWHLAVAAPPSLTLSLSRRERERYPRKLIVSVPSPSGRGPG